MRFISSVATGGVALECEAPKELSSDVLLPKGTPRTFLKSPERASTRWEKRQAKVLDQAKVKMTNKKGSDNAESYWSNLWGKPNDYQRSDEEVKERARRAAAAARRWREYSRKGVDKTPTYKLPEAALNTEDDN
ncbi:hypothetical protein ACFE04_016511 [Oxalis oulophora]